MIRKLFATPVHSAQHWGIILIVALAFIFTPQFDYNDWERNTDGLSEGLHIYDNPNAVYPPWGLILLWPYYLLTSPGSRVASVLVIGWLASQQRWSLLRFLAIILNPFFIWTMLLSNIDVLALLFPVTLWEAVKKHEGWRRTLGRGAAMAVLLIKPQGGILLILYWLWTNRRQWREMLVPVLLVVLIVVPVSLVGRPMLLSQWIDNLRHPSADNQKFWDINNVSLTGEIGLIPAMIATGLALGGLYALFRRLKKPWIEQNHTYAAILLASMLISPYASNQSVIVPIALVASWPATLFQYAFIFAASTAGIYRDLDPLWTLLFGLLALLLYQSAPFVGERERVTPVHDAAL